MQSTGPDTTTRLEVLDKSQPSADPGQRDTSQTNQFTPIRNQNQFPSKFCPRQNKTTTGLTETTGFPLIVSITEGIRVPVHSHRIHQKRTLSFKKGLYLMYAFWYILKITGVVHTHVTSSGCEVTSSSCISYKLLTEDAHNGYHSLVVLHQYNLDSLGCLSHVNNNKNLSSE